VGTVAAVGAIVLGMLALQNKNAYDRTPTYSNTDDGNNLAAYADGCIALAVAGGITSLVLYLTGDRAASPQGSRSSPTRGRTAAREEHAAVFSMSPMVTAHGGGAGAALHF
jgi:hypothetical protein